MTEENTRHQELFEWVIETLGYQEKQEKQNNLENDKRTREPCSLKQVVHM